MDHLPLDQPWPLDVRPGFRNADSALAARTKVLSPDGRPIQGAVAFDPQRGLALVSKRTPLEKLEAGLQYGVVAATAVVHMPGNLKSPLTQEQLEANFQPVKLFTRLGRPEDFVAQVWLIPFKIPADIVSWGTRFFVLSDTSEIDPQGRQIHHYREGLLTFTIDPENASLKVG